MRSGVAKPLKVTSHVGRDLLASAALFKTEAAVVWEYVVNSLQYVERGASPKVQVFVDVKARAIEIRDNGAGMDGSGLAHFFTMHGENRDRLSGRTGRGKFGTGKAAAFGIARRLRVGTRHNGVRNVAELGRETIETSSGSDIPVTWLTRNDHTDLPNGTIITIEEIFLDRINTPSIIEYIERHLPPFRHVDPEVAVNDHVCSYREPRVALTRVFKPTPAQARVLGDVQLVIHASPAPLSEFDQGISVTAGPGNLVAVERGGIEKKEFGSYLFGEVDVPAIEASDSPIEAYDSTRSLQLNPKHPVVAVLVGFIGSKLDEVRQELARQAKEARRTEEARRLAIEAHKIADLLNEDFRKIRQRLQEIRTASASPGAVGAIFGNSEAGGAQPDAWVAGTSEPGRVAETGKGGDGSGRKGRRPPSITARGERADIGNQSVDPAGGNGRARTRPRGGFSVEYRNLGDDEDRSRYDEGNLTILINLDHSVVRSALGEGNVEDISFRRLSYEIAFSEYAMALGYEICKQDPNIPADDLLYEVRSTLNRVAAVAASLYR